jgi:hypothetical protein
MLFAIKRFIHGTAMALDDENHKHLQLKTPFIIDFYQLK